MKLKPARAGHPRRLIAREIAARGWSLIGFENVCPSLPAIMLGGTVTPEAAEQLAELFDMPAQFWLNVQASYDEAKGD